MSGRWFRVYDELVDDPKVQMLPDRTFRALVNLWCLASRNEGVLPSLEQAAFSLRMRPAQLSAIVGQLQVAGLIDADGELLHPHNWSGRQFKSDVTDPTAAERMRRHRNKTVTRGVTDTVTSRSPESETDTETESESEGKKTNTMSAAPTVSVQETFALTEETGPLANGVHAYPEDFEDLWREYRVVGPKTASKAAAYKGFAKLSSTDRKACWSGVVNYAALVVEERQKRPDYPVKHLATFINERGWEPFLEDVA